MKNNFLKTLVLLILFFSCKEKSTLANNTNEISNENKLGNDFVYNEVKGLKKTSDYDLDKEVQKLDIEYKSLLIKIRFIEDRSYISLKLGTTELINWSPFMINFFYDIDISGVENDTHLLLKDNDYTVGYLLFPGFTEQFSTYFLYSFKKGEFNYLGTYEHEEFYNKNNSYSYNEKTQELYINKNNKSSKLKKLDDNELEVYNNFNDDLKLINKYNEDIYKNEEKTLNNLINKWQGIYYYDPFDSKDSIGSYYIDIDENKTNYGYSGGDGHFLHRSLSLKERNDTLFFFDKDNSSTILAKLYKKNNQFLVESNLIRDRKSKNNNTSGVFIFKYAKSASEVPDDK